MLFALVVSGGTFVGCGGSKGGGSPTEPGAGSGAVGAPAGLTVSELSAKDRTVTFTWSAVSGATGYVLEIGRAASATDFAVITLEGGGTSHRVTGIPAGISFARVRTKTASATSAPSADMRFLVPDIRDVIEALFFGTGPHAPRVNTAAGIFKRWPAGSNISTRVAGLTDTQRAAVQRSLDAVADATNGQVRGTITQVAASGAEINFSAAPNEPGQLKVLLNAPGVCSGGVHACGGNHAPLGGLIVGSNIAGTDAGATAIMHEMGHAVLSLAHISWTSDTAFEFANPGPWPGLPLPTMFESYFERGAFLTPTELDAVKMVYASGIAAGVGRSGFHAAGLIRNP